MAISSQLKIARKRYNGYFQLDSLNNYVPLFSSLITVFFIILFISKLDLSQSDLILELFEDHDIKLVTCQNCEFFFSEYFLTNYFDSILQHINIILYDNRD